MSEAAMFEGAMERSRELFSSGWYCAESVLLAVAENQAIDCECIPGIATGLCSGLSRTAGPCGAVTGAVLGISLVLGRRRVSDPLDECYCATQELLNEFAELFGADTCQALTGCHLGTGEGQARFKNEGIHEQCLGFVAEATRLALKAIVNHREPLPS